MTANRVLSSITGAFFRRLAPGDRFDRRKASSARSSSPVDIATTCGFCSTGCGLSVRLDANGSPVLTPARSHPVNLGCACPKGWEALRVLDSPERATRPLLRDADGVLRPISWPEAFEAFVAGFRRIVRDHGPESVAFIGTGQITTEEIAFMGALAKFGLGFRHGDSNTRQCMATAVAAYKECFGFDAPPYAYADLEESDLVVLIGSNLAIAHPILWERLLRNRRGARVVVIDPRRTETAAFADSHLALRPKTDLALLYGLAHVLIREGWHDRDFVAEHTNGFEDFRRHVERFSPDRVAIETGIPEPRILELARAIHESERASFWWTMGVNQSYDGVRTAQAVIALALLTGHIGRPGTGPNAITGQCNAMGARLFSNTSSLIGGRSFDDPAHRAEVARVLGIPEASIPPSPGRSYDEIVDGIERGEIRGLWVVGTNPAHSWIGREGLDEAFARLDLLVVEDMYHTTETARLAHLVLPAAGWGEKDGTFINSERRIGRTRRVVDPPGEARSDFEIFRGIAAAAGCAQLFEEWKSPARVFEILKRLSAGRPFDFSGVPSLDSLDESGGIQWPFPPGSETVRSERRLFEDRRFFTPDRRARFVVGDPSAVPEPTCDEFPFWLLTGRGTSAQWHTQTRTRQSAVLRSLHASELTLEMHPGDMDALALAPGDLARIDSRRGSIVARVVPSPGLASGQVFLPMHWPGTNRLTLAHFDPISRQPSYKDAAVRVARHVQAGGGAKYRGHHGEFPRKRKSTTS